MKADKTRIRLTWFGVVVIGFMGSFAMFKGFEGVATTCAAGVIALVTGYQASRGWTKTAAFKSESTTSPIE